MKSIGSEAKGVLENLTGLALPGLAISKILGAAANTMVDWHRHTAAVNREFYDMEANLGNIGEKYVGTRHNIGFEIIDSIIKDNDIVEQIERLVLFSNFKYKGKHIYLIKPTTYMNNSGRAVKYWKEKWSDKDSPLQRTGQAL